MKKNKQGSLSSVRAIKHAFDSFNVDDFGDFDLIKRKRSEIPEIHALLLLESIFHEFKRLIHSAHSNIISLTIGVKDLEAKVTINQIHELVCCGVTYDDTEKLEIWI